MAEKLTDQELADELRRHGEQVKLPIDRKRRPILVKKLNHYRVKENPPVKRSKSGSRQPRKSSAPAEFSDGSQDETETAGPSSSKNSQSDRATASYNTNRRTSRGRTSKTESNGANIVPSPVVQQIRRPPRTPGKRVTEVKQLELYPSEFSDTDGDTADESVYEVENKSINTTFTLNNTLDDEDDANFSAINMSQNRITRSGGRLGNAHAYLNHFDSEEKLKKEGFKTKDEASDFSLKEHHVSKTILTVLAVFFVVLAVSYAWVKSDVYLTKEASLQTGLKENQQLCDQMGGNCLNFTKAEGEASLTVISQLLNKLSALKGQVEVDEIKQEACQWNKDKIRQFISQNHVDADMVDRILVVSLGLIFHHPEWDFKTLGADLAPAGTRDEIEVLEAVYGDLPLVTRVWLAIWRVFYGFCLLLFCVLIGVFGIYYLRWQNKRREREQRKVYDMVEKIIEILKENSELAERKNDADNYPAYMAVQHIRDQLIPVAQRKQMQPLWNEAVKFIEANESRIRVETQTIQGEEFTVWRWLQTFPNGGRMWQGQAFGESQGSINTLPYGPTPCLKVRNMFDTNMEEKHGHMDWPVDIEDAILEKCKPNHGILHIHVDTGSREGCVYIKCSSCEKAYETYSSLHGWWFDGRLVTVKYLRLEHYHDRFPDSRNRRYPLKPSTNSMHSVSRPYHRSALEMT